MRMGAKRAQLSLLMAVQFVCNTVAWTPPVFVPRPRLTGDRLAASSSHSSRRQALAFNPIRMNAICDAKSFEEEYSALKAPGVGLPGASGDGDLFGQFGNMLQGLASGGDASTLKASKETSAVKSGPTADAPILDGLEVLEEHPHVRESFTQGLWWCDEEQRMYEGSGGPSFSCGTRLTKYDVATGDIEMGRMLPDKFFGEGICGLGDKLYQLTWTTKVGFVYDRKTMKLVDQWKYDYQGWGMTTDGESLIVSDGTATLHFLDPKTLKETRTLVVRSRGVKNPTMQPLRRINDLQWVKGDIYANIWENDRIAVIDPCTGVVKRFIECRGLLDENDPWIRQWSKSDRCLNGLAYDARKDRLYITGKLWTTIYECKVLPGQGDLKEPVRSNNAYGGEFDPLGMGM